MNSGKQPKIEAEVEVELEDGSQFFGAMFAFSYQRVSDILNDERSFLPLTTSSGVRIINKQAIRAVTPLARNKGPQLQSDCPYRILGVSETADDGTLREAYLAMTRTTHPDKLRGLGLADEFVALATRKMAIVNDAYNRIRKMRAAKPVF